MIFNKFPAEEYAMVYRSLFLQNEFPSFGDSTTGCYQRKQIIADFVKQNYPSAE